MFDDAHNQRESLANRLYEKWLFPIGACIFFGIMMDACAVAFAPEVILPAAKLICSGKAELTSKRFNVVPGETVIDRTYRCTSADGTEHNITWASGFVFVLLASSGAAGGLMLYRLGNRNS